MYPFMTLNDDTKITHSKMKKDGKVNVYIETSDDSGEFPRCNLLASGFGVILH